MFSKSVMPGVELRLCETRHAVEMYAVVDANRKYLRQWLPWIDATSSVDVTRDWIRKSLKQFALNKGLHAAIWSGGAIVGVVGCQVINWVNRRVELGYWLAESAQGKGIMTASVRALVDHAFDEWLLNRVQIQCAAGNVKSQAVPRRLGFQEEGVILQGQLLNGEFHDLVVFGMLREHWRRHSAAKVESA